MIHLKKELKSDKLKFKLLIRHPLGTFKEEENYRRLCSISLGSRNHNNTHLASASELRSAAGRGK